MHSSVYMISKILITQSQAGPSHRLTCTELVMVLRAKTVAQSFMVDWLSKAPCVSTNRTATCRGLGYCKSPLVDQDMMEIHLTKVQPMSCRDGHKIINILRQFLSISMVVCQSKVHLAPIWLVDHKHLTPDLDPCRLPLTASSPAEPCQRLIISPNPRV